MAPRGSSACRSGTSLGCRHAPVEQRVGFGGGKEKPELSRGRAGARNQRGLLSRACPFCQGGEYLSTRLGYSGTKKAPLGGGAKGVEWATSPPVLICPEE
jgi:hypothetical protein